MATYYWDGSAADNDWSTAANWTAATVPVTGDTAVFDGRTTENCTAGMDQTGVDLANLVIRNSYSGTIGATLVPLIIECSGTMWIEGSGNYYIQCGNDANDADVAATYINTGGMVELSSQKNQAAGNVAIWTAVYIFNGEVTFMGVTGKPTSAEDGTAFGDLYIYPQKGRRANATVIIGDACYDQANTALGDVIMSEGTLTFYSDLGALTMYNGKATMGGTSYTMAADTDDDITTLTMYNGNFYWHPSVVASSKETTASHSPLITTANIYGGKFDGTGMRGTVSTAPTVTTINLWPGTELDINNGLGNFIITTLNNYGGEISTSRNQALTLA